MRLVKLKSGFIVDKSLADRRIRDIARLFLSHEKAMYEVCEKVHHLIPQIDENEELQCFRKQPHFVTDKDIKLEDFYDLEIKGIIHNFRYELEFGTKFERESNDFYFYEIDQSFAKVIYNCVTLNYGQYNLVNPFLNSRAENLRAPSSYAYSR